MSSATTTATDVDIYWMQRALALAAQAQQLGEVPVGAVVVVDGKILAEGYNQPIATHDPTAHAEIVALRAATQAIGNYRLQNASLYVTLEPCPMCAGAIVQARITRIIFGAPDPLAGAAGSVFDIFGAPSLNHHPRVSGGMLADDCAQLLKQFFKARRL